ncbi:ion channel [Thalassomonas haliotis]|uniref:Pentapeptide repeat-containing protein n=1 Tax=Thalassomonas haliotis TaxID=485448 RepID=A0ABY7VAK2_9GAMM|nr:ion channel [Thalassomonas haliotis]WDE09923.1 pentapeptide repeat-containing protein [Thalassomonas haliotis]
MDQEKPQCQYKDPENYNCSCEANESGLCFWHDPSTNKKGPEIKQALEEYAKSGGLLRGISLKRANLKEIDLVNHNKKAGYDFSYADLYRADLEGAHLFNITFNHASLMKTDLRYANLNCASLQQANLLGVRWSQSKVENLRIGKKLKQEYLAHQALKDKNLTQAHDYFEQAEEIYRDLRKHAEREGIFAMAGEFIQKELTMRRMQLPKFSTKRLTSKVIDLFCGYGEAPVRIIGISILIIICCAFIYAMTGLNYQGDIQTFDSSASFTDNFSLYLSCLYYSVVTFTTLGYGDFTPVGISRTVAAVEAFTGSFTIALFVVVFVKKMTR